MRFARNDLAMIRNAYWLFAILPGIPVFVIVLLAPGAMGSAGFLVVLGVFLFIASAASFVHRAPVAWSVTIASFVTLMTLLMFALGAFVIWGAVFCILLWGYVPVARSAVRRQRRFQVRDDVFE